MKPYSHCHRCGTAYENENWPRRCTNTRVCGIETYRRTDGVAVLLQPVMHRDQIGLLIGMRGIQPCLGQWALPGGFIEYDELGPNAAARELFEEMGLRTPFDPEHFHEAISGHGQHLHFYASDTALKMSQIDQWVSSQECTDMRVIFKPATLCFDTHTEAVAKWFASNLPTKCRDYFAFDTMFDWDTPSD